KPNWEHLNDKLHVLITVEDSNNRASVKIQRAIDEIKKLLIPITDGEDELKKRQLMELAIINGTYRDSSQRNSSKSHSFSVDLWFFVEQCMQLGIDAEQLHKLTPIPMALTTPLRHHAHHQTPIGAPLIISSRQFTVPTSAAHHINGSGLPPLIAPTDGILYSPYADFHSQYAALTSPSAAALLAEYPTTSVGTAVIDSLTSTGGLYTR
ncbi:unnamed protein product, partial [Oppiella nova]